MKNLRYIQGQSTIELALILPILILLLSYIILGFRANHTASDQTQKIYAERIQKFNHGNGLVFDPIKKVYIPAGQYTEVIPPSSVVDPDQIARLAASFLAQLGLNEIFSRIPWHDDTYYGAFAKGFTTTFVSGSTQELIMTGKLENYDKHLENAAWAGGAQAMSSADATEDFQGADDTASSAREFFGSGAQSAAQGFFASHGDWKATVTSGVGGTLSSDTTKGWVNDGMNPDKDNTWKEMGRGALIGAVQSSASGIVDGEFNVKTVMFGAGSGAISTDAFANSLPFKGKAQGKDSAMYGAVNGAFGSLASGGDWKSTLTSSGMGALGSNQAAAAMGGSKSFGYGTARIAGGAASGYINGGSVEAVGYGALSSAVGWGTQRASSSLRNRFDGNRNAESATQTLNNVDTSKDYANEMATDPTLDSKLTATTDAMILNEYAKSLQPPKDSTKESKGSGL